MTVRELHIIHHSHTDLGFTHDPPIVRRLHGRFLEQAMRLCEEHAGDAMPMRWTVEAWGVLGPWLERAAPADIDRLLRLQEAGLIEVTALPNHQTPLAGPAELAEGMAAALRLAAAHGIRLRHAMSSDVNGQNWPLVDVLLDAGIAGITFATNPHFGRVLEPRPRLFRWLAGDGRPLPTYNGLQYGQAGGLGIPGDTAEAAAGRIAALLERLGRTGWTAEVAMVTAVDPFGDNAGPDPRLPAWIAAWNAAGRLPRLVLSTPTMWWAAAAPAVAAAPALRGDWTDAWNFGALHRAAELAQHRRSRQRLLGADALLAVGGRVPAEREAAWLAQRDYDEHTWSADCAVEAWESEDAAVQQAHKSALAAEARSLSQLMLRDALAALAARVAVRGPGQALVWNPLPWERTVRGTVPAAVSRPRGRAADPTAARHAQDRKLDLELLARTTPYPNPWGQEPTRELKPVSVPGFGFRIVDLAEGACDPFAETSEDGRAVIVHGEQRLTFDLQRGGIRSWRSAAGQELVEAGDWPLGGWVHERVDAPPGHPAPRSLIFDLAGGSGWNPAWPVRRSGATTLLDHRVTTRFDGTVVRQLLDAPGAVGPVSVLYHCPRGEPWIEVQARWTLPADPWPQATYLALPFAGVRPVAHVDVGLPMRAGRDQLPGAHVDWFTAQRWFDLAWEGGGVTVASPEHPLVQLGGLRFGAASAELALDRPTAFLWTSCNYWEVNFAAHQAGPLTVRFRLQPYAGPFDAGRAHRLGEETAARQPLLQRLDEAPAEHAVLPTQGSLLHLPFPPIAVEFITPQPDGRWMVGLRNLADTDQVARITDGVLTIRHAWSCDLSGSRLTPLEAPTLNLAPYASGRLLLEVAERRA